MFYGYEKFRGEIFMFIIFDIGPILLIVAVFLLALADCVAEAMPIIVVIYWIIYALSTVFLLFMTIFDDSKYRIPKTIMILISRVLMIFLSVGFLSIISQAATEGVFSFILVTVFSGIEFILFTGLPAGAESELSLGEDFDFPKHTAFMIGAYILEIVGICMLY